MSDDWLKKCLQAAQTPWGQAPNAFDNQDPLPQTPKSKPSSPTEAQGIEVGWTEDAIVILLRTPGERPKVYKLDPEAAMTLSETMKKFSLLLMFKNSLKGSQHGSEDSGPEPENA